VGDHPLVSWFVTGLFNQKPALPCYSETLNPQIVLNHWKLVTKATHSEISHAYGTPLRTQTLKKLPLEDMSTSPGKYIFHISSLLKHTSAKGGQNRHLFPITFTSYDVDERLCVVELLTAYIERTATLRKTTKQLLICYAAPHGPTSKDTLSGCVR